ncbi:MAG: carbohydrate kinase family protein [Ignavibacteriae bacterium]|nr:MAG: carbohydrate kinase family protein [Ignavibacteriota bacterium]
MKLGVIGEPCIDYIHRGNGEPKKTLGGILYSVVSLALIAKEDEVYPIFNLGNDEYDYILNFLSQFKNIRTDYVNKVEHKVRVVSLYYNKAQGAEYICEETGRTKIYDREENSTEPTAPVDFSVIEPALYNLDALLINMISGSDVTLDTLKQVRLAYPKHIHLDIHNIVMRTNEKGERIQQPVNDWLEWCCQCSTLQMNESEINIITPERLKEYDFAEKILSTEGKGPGALIITRGKSGVTLYVKKVKDMLGEHFVDIDKKDFPAVERDNFKDSTGCGDVLASSFLFKMASGHDYETAINFSNKMAGFKSTLQGVEELYQLGNYKIGTT